MTNGQIAYEGYFKACGGRSLISGALLPNWNGQDVLVQAAWEHSAAAVLAAQWKPASEVPTHTHHVLVTDGYGVCVGWYYNKWDSVSMTASRITHWRELPPLPEA